MENLKKFIEIYTKLTDNEWNQIKICFNQHFVSKGEIILEQGRICNYLYFLETGLLRFVTIKDGNEITKFFTEAPYFLLLKQVLIQENQLLKILLQ